MMQVIPAQGDPTIYFCESDSLECVNPECYTLNVNGERNRTLYDKRKLPTLAKGDFCPKCGARLDIRFLTVCITDYNNIGSCTCEWFKMGHHMERELKLMLPGKRKEIAEQVNCKYRCKHINRVRVFCLNITASAHERENGRKEEAA